MLLIQPLYFAVADFKQAFNFVNSTILFVKLIESCIHGKVKHFLRDMYLKNKARIKVGNWLYRWIQD